MSKLATLLLLITLFIPNRVDAQDASSYALQSESKMWIDGTSNKSDWTVTATEMTGHVTLNPTADTLQFEETRVVVASKKIVSNKSTIMDRLMYKALKATQHPQIEYALTSATVTAMAGDSFTVDAVGNLMLAGVTKEITMPVEGKKLADGQYRFTGSYTLLMTDYKMRPPTAMFGALRTGDEVIVNFDLTLGPEMPKSGTQ